MTQPIIFGMQYFLGTVFSQVFQLRFIHGTKCNRCYITPHCFSISNCLQRSFSYFSFVTLCEYQYIHNSKFKIRNSIFFFKEPLLRSSVKSLIHPRYQLASFSQIALAEVTLLAEVSHRYPVLLALLLLGVLFWPA